MNNQITTERIRLMKQLFKNKLWLLVVLTLALLLTSCGAKVESVTDDAAIVFASINSPSGIPEGDASAIKGTVQWLVDNAEAQGIDYVSFLGGFTAKPEDTYADYTKNKLDTKNLININKEDEGFMAHFDALKETFDILDETSIPYGLTYAVEDNFGYGGYRESTYPDVFDEDAYNEKVEEHFAFDEQNYYTAYTVNEQKYIVFQLESMPTIPVVAWFNEVMKEKCDYRAIVFTESLIDENGEFWQMWDWASGYPYKAENRGNTKLRAFNILWTEKPNDGIALWNASFAKHDNLLLVVTSNADTDLVTRVEKTNGGCDVAIIAGKTGSNALLVGISEDNKTVTAGLVSGEGECVGDIVKLKLETISPLEPPIDKNIPRVIQMQPNGANKAYMFSDSDKFKPQSTVTRGEVLNAVATLIGIHPAQKRAENRFEDIKEGDKYYDSINYLDSLDLIDYIEEKAAPDTAMTRGELAKILYRAAVTVDSFAGSIADVTDDTEEYYEYTPVIASGYMEPDDKGNFNPADKVTKAQLVTIMNRVIGLNANEKTIDISLLKNTFTDIEIPEKYDILAATNANVEAPYHKDIRTEGITETKSSFIFENELSIMTVEKNGAKVTSIVDKKSGENVLYSKGILVELDSPATRSSYPVSMELDGDRFRFTFEGGEVLYMIIEAHDTFFTFELDTEMPLPETCVSYAVFDTAAEFSNKPDSLRLSGMLMNTNTYTEYYGGGDAKATGASVTKSFVDTMGSKYGVVACQYQDFVSAMQRLADDVDPTVGITNKVGGAYAVSSPSNYGDYCIISSINPSNVDQEIALAKKYNLKQVDIHQGATSFVQGDYIPGEGFRFPRLETETASEFKELVADKYHEAGLELGLHIYSFYIAPGASNVLSVPEYQKQLEYSEVLTLAEDISKGKTKFATVEDCTNFDLKTSFTYKNSKYVLIDEEIMEVRMVGPEGFKQVVRAQCGTERQEHKAGAEIRHLIQYYGMFAPVIGSDLFYNMAEWVAETYNKGGFDMIYFDAHDGMVKHTDAQWYYGAEFVRIVLEKCENPPLIELSTIYPTLWASRSRMVAWDTATRAYKQFNQNHLNTNKGWMDKMYPATFGWFNYAPDSGYTEKNTIAKTLFEDDLDHMGSLAIAWNISTVYNNFLAVQSNKVMAHNIEYYNVYNKLRLDGYFTEEVKEQLRNGKYEYKLFEKDGEWVFREMKYSKAKIYNADDKDLNYGVGNNPFEEQTPFIRIEARYSTLFENEKVLLELDETQPITNFAGKRTNMSFGKLTNTKAMKVRVFGNNSDTDAIMISLTYTGPGLYEYTDYVIPLNFEGWKEIILVDSDCGDYGKYTFSGRNVNAVSWDMFREVPDYGKINGIDITLCGKCEGVMMDDIVAYKHTTAPMRYPSVTIGDETITFKTKLEAGQYIEYDPNTNTAKLNFNNGESKKISFKGSVTVPSGSFTYTYSAEALTDAPVRAQVVIGCQGKEIANN